MKDLSRRQGMLVYECVRNFFCGSLDLPIHVGERVWRFEKQDKLFLENIDDIRGSRQGLNRVSDKWEAVGTKAVEWLTAPVITKFFQFVGQYPEPDPGDLVVPITDYTVGENTKYLTIEAAMAAAAADGIDNPLIFLRPGLHEPMAPFTLDHKMRLQGSGDGTVLRVCDAGPVITVTGIGVNISNMVIDGCGIASTGVLFDGACRSQIMESFIRDTNGSSVTIDNGSEYISVDSNTLQGFVNPAVNELSGDFNKIVNNTII